MEATMAKLSRVVPAAPNLWVTILTPQENREGELVIREEPALVVGWEVRALRDDEIRSDDDEPRDRDVRPIFAENYHNRHVTKFTMNRPRLILLANAEGRWRVVEGLLTAEISRDTPHPFDNFTLDDIKTAYLADLKQTIEMAREVREQEQRARDAADRDAAAPVVAQEDDEIEVEDEDADEVRDRRARGRARLSMGAHLYKEEKEGFLENPPRRAREFVHQIGQFRNVHRRVLALAKAASGQPSVDPLGDIASWVELAAKECDCQSRKFHGYALMMAVNPDLVEQRLAEALRVIDAAETPEVQR
jgi:hypothetical protein